jgi:hypothetical protein
LKKGRLFPDSFLVYTKQKKRGYLALPSLFELTTSSVFILPVAGQVNDWILADDTRLSLRQASY